MRALTPAQRDVFVASFLGWTLDAFDYFILPLTSQSVADDLRVPVTTVLFALTATLALRPVGALIFGALADRYGRRTPLMIDIALFSALELASAFAPNIAVFVILRALFGVAMGGEWGLGAAMALEHLPARSRGLFSGLLQQGYAVGYLLAALVAGAAFTHIGWRGMFALGALPALLVLFIRARVPEPEPARTAPPATSLLEALRGATGQMGRFARELGDRRGLFLYAVLLMAAFNALSHGTQDNYPLLLRQHGFSREQVSLFAIVANVGAILGGVLLGASSQRLGRRRAIVVATLVGLAVVPFWAYASAPLAVAAAGFAMQFAVQGAWGVIPAHLNELSPADLRGTFPGFCYQLGNLLASWVAQLEGVLALGAYRLPGGGGDYARSLLLFVAIALGLVAIVTALGKERRDADLSTGGGAT